MSHGFLLVFVCRGVRGGCSPPAASMSIFRDSVPDTHPMPPPYTRCPHLSVELIFLAFLLNPEPHMSVGKNKPTMVFLAVLKPIHLMPTSFGGTDIFGKV